MAAAAVFTECTKKIHPAVANVSFLLLPRKLDSASLAGFELNMWPSLGAHSWFSWPPRTWGLWQVAGMGQREWKCLLVVSRVKLAAAGISSSLATTDKYIIRWPLAVFYIIA